MTLEGFSKADSKLFYLSIDEDFSFRAYEQVMNNLQDSDWLVAISAGGSGCITLNNGTELIFMPQAESIHLMSMGIAEHVFIEEDNATMDLVEMLTPNAKHISVVDSKTFQLL